MTHVITITNRKGGAGKTTTAHALAAGLKRQGFQVLMIDLDSQGNLTHAAGVPSVVFSALDILTGEAPTAKAIQSTPSGDIIPAGPELAAADQIITETGKEYRLREALEPILPSYEYVVIDTPAQLGILTVNALTASQLAVIPVQAEVYSLRGIALLYDAVRAVQKYTNPCLKVSGVLVTRYNTRTTLSRDMKENLQAVADQLGTKLYITPVRECVAIAEAAALQKDIYSHAPRSNAARDYSEFVKAIMEETTE